MDQHQAGSEAFVHEIRVGWAHSDPARIAYTGQIPMFALEAIDAWWEAMVGLDWYRMNVDNNIGAPFVHLDLDFRSPVTPRHRLRCKVILEHLGNSSVRFRVSGFQNDVLCFEGGFVEVFVEADNHGKSVPIPEEIRGKISGLVSP